MPVTWTKNLTSATFTRNTPPEGTSVELVHRVHAKDGANVHPWDPFTSVLTMDDEDLPAPGVKLSGIMPGTTTSDWSNYFRCRSVRWRFVDSSRSVWECSSSFTSKDAWCPLPHVWRTDSTQVRSVDVYRDVAPGATLTNGQRETSITNSADTYLDDSGKPTTTEIAQQSCQVSFIWNTSIVVAGPGYPDVANLIDEGWLNCRNDEAFLGWPAGTVRLMGVRVDPDEDEYVRVTYDFLYDQWGHMTQEPRRDSDGRVELDLPGAEIIPRAKSVIWKQLWYDLKDFNELLSADEVDWLTEGWRTYDQLECPENAENATAYTVKPSEAQVGTTSEIREYEA